MEHGGEDAGKKRGPKPERLKIEDADDWTEVARALAKKPRKDDEEE